MEVQGKTILWVTNAQIGTKRARIHLAEMLGCELVVISEAELTLKLAVNKPAMVVVELDCVDGGSDKFMARHKFHVAARSTFVIGPYLCHLIRKRYPEIKLVTFGIQTPFWNSAFNEMLGELLPDRPWDLYLGPFPDFDDFSGAIRQL
ncbi:TPA: hypothetical protein DF272_06800 [Candidatus Falkowbacteria bacterium]|nr:hypothetical protein [Candidatus Falkowbacteria bacterium]